MENALRPRNLLPHLTNSSPSPTDPGYRKWLAEGDAVYSWLLETMTQDMYRRHLRCKSAKEIWDAVQKHHSKSKDRSRIGFLLNKGATLKQGERSVSEYSGEVLEIYDELDYYRPPIATTNFDQVQQDRTYHFLHGLQP